MLYFTPHSPFPQLHIIISTERKTLSATIAICSWSQGAHDQVIYIRIKAGTSTPVEDPDVGLSIHRDFGSKHVFHIDSVNCNTGTLVEVLFPYSHFENWKI